MTIQSVEALILKSKPSGETYNYYVERHNFLHKGQTVF